jgi:hypothetical protein
MHSGLQDVDTLFIYVSVTRVQLGVMENLLPQGSTAAVAPPLRRPTLCFLDRILEFAEPFDGDPHDVSRGK